jgi:hypothetical protein
MAAPGWEIALVAAALSPNDTAMVDSVVVENVITPLLTMLDSPDDGVVNAYRLLLIEKTSSVASLMMSNEVMVSRYGRFLLEQQI